MHKAICANAARERTLADRTPPMRAGNPTPQTPTKPKAADPAAPVWDSLGVINPFKWLRGRGTCACVHCPIQSNREKSTFDIFSLSSVQCSTSGLHIADAANELKSQSGRLAPPASRFARFEQAGPLITRLLAFGAAGGVI